MLQPSLDNAIAAIRNLILNFGKDIVFVKRQYYIDKQIPTKSSYEEERVIIKGLWHYQGKKLDQTTTMTTPAGNFDVSKVIVTILAEDVSRIKDFTFFVINGVRYKISKVSPAIGFKTETDRYYIYGDITKK